MDDQGLSHIKDELPELSALSTQDIPTAVREAASTPYSPARSAQPNSKAAKQPNLTRVLLLGLGLAALSIPVWLLRDRLTPQAASEPPATASPPSSAPRSASPTASPADLLGHSRYAEAPASELVPLSSGGGILLRKAAAQKLEEMLEAAAADGISLSVISGFRSIADQNMLFFDVKAARGEDPSERAAVSAPPGYSEHHTGYAVDIGDSAAPSADLQFTFEQTKAFKWLEKNAAYYSFEMSFPKGNPEGVSYEPWHWRFVGDSQSLETFYRDRSSRRSTPQNSPPDSGRNSGRNSEN